ncbi:MAG: DUF3365 domain-containing protein [Gammaproteobacteria bacterium]|nr:DUF3365 domain-containing protein [Gammaproteobacteria bacterium]
MKSRLLTAVALFSIIAPAMAGDTEDRMSASRMAANDLGGALKTALGAAIKEGGAVNAIQVCNTKAPSIAADLSSKKGWKVARTSLKLRNARNAPDAWETKVLKEFDARRAKGEDPATLEHGEMVMAGGKHEFRYMKAIAIPADAPCLQCHGSNIDPAVSAKLKALYPQDNATGYKTGELRGAFTITQPM